MISSRHWALVATLALAAPLAETALGAQGSVAFDQGWQRGRIAGFDAGRDGNRFRFDNLDEYRRADYGYRSEYGTRDRYRNDFRLGFEQGYRQGYARIGSGRGYGPPPWSNGRG